MFTQEEISKRIRDQLYILDPDISLEVGTPERKIIDSVAQSLAEIQFDKFVQTYQLDIDTKFGQDLDDFIQLFGFARQTARRASGFVVFTRKTPAPSPIYIPAGTQVSTTESGVSSTILFSTVTDAIIPESGSYVEVPIEATIPGAIGNVSANKINRIISVSRDVSNVNNPTSTTGGTEQETDDELKIRFKNNIFRNIAGTRDQFLALAIANQYTNRATIIGPTSKFREYMTIQSGGTASSFNPNAKSVYNFNYFLSTEGNDISRFYTPDVDYEFDIVATATGGSAPVISVNNVVNPAPTAAPIAGTSTSENFLQGSFKYAYTYTYNPGGESAISPLSNTVTLSEQVGTVTTIVNSSATSLASGTVSSKTLYRKNINEANAVWESVGTMPVRSSFSVTGVQRTAGGTVTLYIGGGSADLAGIEVANGGGNGQGTIIVAGVTTGTAAGTALNGTFGVTSIGSSSLSYVSAGTTFGSVSASAGSVIANITSFYDNLSVPIGEPPTNDLSTDSVVFLEHEYLSKWSRNVYSVTDDYSSLNKVDVYISGQTSESAEDVTVAPGNIIVNNQFSKFHYENFTRGNGTVHPGTGNYFVNLIWNPVRTIPSTLTINGDTYQKDYDYWLLKDVTNLRDSYRGRDGIELSSAMAGSVNNSVFSIQYTFDKLPFLTNKVMDSHKQVGQDVLVHTAKFRSFRVNLIAIYNNGFVTSSVNAELTNNLEDFFNQQSFGAIIQINDIVQIAYQTSGIDNVKLATSSDATAYGFVNYGIEEIDESGTVINRYTEDFLLEDIDLPKLYSLGPDTQGTSSPVAPFQRTQNNWIV
jgi:hypothetical protein